MSLLQRWLEVAADYRQIKTLGEDHEDVVAAILFTIGTLACGLGIAAIIGGFHG